jgi:hypothetical protein
MLFSIISILVGCSGGEKEATETPATPAATEAAPATPAVVPATEPCVDSTPDDGVDNCAKDTVTSTTEATADQPTVVVVAK